MVSYFSLAVWLALFIYGCNQVIGHAYYMCETTYCSTPLSAGTTIMGYSVAYGDSRKLIVSRNVTNQNVTKMVQLSSGTTYIPGEILNVTISSSDTLEYLFEITQGEFIDGGCSGRRYYNEDASAIMPSAGSGNVEIWVGWATSHSRVYITGKFLLVDPNGTNSSSSADNSSSLGNQSDMIIGVIFGVGGSIVVATILLFILQRQSASTSKSVMEGGNGDAYISKTTSGSSTDRYLGAFAGNTAIALSIVCVALVLSWAQNKNSSSQSGYLGLPTWSSNPFAWHVVLMVAGYFLSQTFALLVWTFVPDTDFAKFLHTSFHVAGIITLSIGLAAVVRDTNNSKAPSLTTIHSWCGVTTVVVYLCNFLWGLWMTTLKAFYPNSEWKKHFDLLALHKSFGIAALGLTAVTILTGIMDALPEGACYDPSWSYSQVDSNPAGHYSGMPNGCKLGNGLGLVVLLTVACVVVAIATRFPAGGTKKEDFNQGLL